MSTTRGLTSFSIIMPLVLTVRRLPYTVLGSFASLLLVPRSLEEAAASVGGAMEYEWKWGTDYVGRGRLRAQEGGRVLTGTWGYTRATEGAGTWQLRRVER